MLNALGSDIFGLKYLLSLVFSWLDNVIVFLYSDEGFRSGGAEASGNRKRDAHRKRAGGKASGSTGSYVLAATGGL